MQGKTASKLIYISIKKDQNIVYAFQCISWQMANSFFCGQNIRSKLHLAFNSVFTFIIAVLHLNIEIYIYHQLFQNNSFFESKNCVCLFMNDDILSCNIDLFQRTVHPISTITITTHIFGY